MAKEHIVRILASQEKAILWYSSPFLDIVILGIAENKEIHAEVLTCDFSP